MKLLSAAAAVALAATGTAADGGDGAAVGLMANARASSGCGKAPPASPGKTTVMSGTFGGVSRKWRINVPSGYKNNVAVPLVVSTHGWGGSGLQDEIGSGLSKTGGGQITVYPDGMKDRFALGFWGSWNAVGSTQSPGSQGQICDKSADRYNQYCYTSCKGCKGSDGCDWTTCTNDITPTGIGTKDVNGFLPQLYDLVESQFCVDVSREFHTGMSNGAMMTYQVGVSMAPRMAAVAPNAGSFHLGFAAAPATKVPLLDLHGTADKTVPANETGSSDGWYYTKNKDIVALWTKANGCSKPKAAPYKGPVGVSAGVASSTKLGCVDWGCDVVTCAHNGGHDYFSTAANNAKLTWAFLSQYQNTQHIGRGLVVGQEEELARQIQLDADRFADVAVVADDDAEVLPVVGIDVADDTDAYTFEADDDDDNDDQPHGRHRGYHYGNPRRRGGCLPGEDVVVLSDGVSATGRVCAARRTAGLTAAGATDDGAQSSALCSLGGVEPDPADGCPTRLPRVNAGRISAFPQCALDAEVDGDLAAHCFLTCDPCRTTSGANNSSGTAAGSGDNAGCSQEAHDMCPRGAYCMLGQLRNVRMGLCVYP